MSSPAFTQARTIIQAAIADSSNSQFVDDCINQAQREVCRARRWPEIMSRAFFNTVAEYHTGTVAVTDGGTTVTLTGGTFPSAVATAPFYRFALAVPGPWVTVRTRTDSTHIEIAQAWIRDTVTASAFSVYRSHYSLPSTVDRVEEVWLHDNEAVPLTNAATDETVTQFVHYPSGVGVPSHYMNMERDASGNRQILLGPETPDDVYRVEYVYRRRAVDNQFEGNLDDSRWPLIVARAKSIAYEPEFYERSIAEMRRYEALLMTEWANENESETESVRVGQTRIDAATSDLFIRDNGTTITGSF